MSRASHPTKRIVARRRLVLAAFVAAILALTTALAFAQEHGSNTGHAATAHGANGTAAEPPHGAAAHGDTEGAQSGEHRSDAEGTEGGEHADHAGGHHGPEPLNWTNIWDKKRPAIIALLINFGVLMTIYYMVGKKPVADALKQRRVTIGKEIDEAQALLAEAKERAKKYQAELDTADADAASAKAALVAAGKGEVEHMLTDAKERADRMKRDADRLVEQERKQMQLDLLNETVELAVREASVLLEKTVTADDHARLAQDLLAELARRPAARSVNRGGAA